MKPISIYIVEDELLISASLKSQLQQFGYEICGSAIRGETSVEEIAALSEIGKEPEIVLMDIHLRGEIDGIETAKLINERFNCAIIFLTGQSSKEIYERSFRIKPFGYLLKPIDMEQTKMTIEIAAYQRNLEIENRLYQRDLEALLEKRSLENREQMLMYQTIIDNSLIGLTIIQDDKFVFANKKSADIFGITPEQFLSYTCAEIFRVLHPDDKKKISELTTLRNEPENLPVKVDFRIFVDGNEIRHIESHIKPVHYMGRPAIHQTFLDVTDRYLN
jgi:PAS domain S-box-containing protein